MRVVVLLHGRGAIACDAAPLAEPLCSCPTCRAVLLLAVDADVECDAVCEACGDTVGRVIPRARVNDHGDVVALRRGRRHA